MKYLLVLTIFLVGCQSSIVPLPKNEQLNALSGVSFGMMTESSKSNKNTAVKKAGFSSENRKKVKNRIKNDYQSLKEDLEPIGARVHLIGRDIIVTIFNDSIFLNRLSLNLKPNSEQTLSEISDYLSNRKNSYVEITGYTDTVGNANANQRLSVEKARRISLYFIQEGHHPIRFFINGRGENSPIAKSPQQNRRIDIKISPMIK